MNSKYLKRNYSLCREADDFIEKWLVRVNGTIVISDYMIEEGDVVEIYRWDKDYW